MFGYVDGPGPSVRTATPAARLNQLQRHIDAWNALDWMESRMTFSTGRHGISVLREGVYALISDDEVTCIQLPSLTRGVHLRVWKLGSLGFPGSEVYSIEISPSNNLLVLVSK
jgi:hypothetical protein